MLSLPSALITNKVNALQINLLIFQRNEALQTFYEKQTAYYSVRMGY